MTRAPLVWFSLTLVVCGGLAGCGDPDVPAEPTWVDDVQPILKGNCFSCHGGLDQGGEGGAGSLTELGAPRLDIYDIGRFQELGPFDGLTGVVAPATRLQLKAVFAANGRTQMPPPPASPLRERDRRTLVKWLANPLLGERAVNHPPSAQLVREGIDGGDLVVVFDVTDGDGDTVLGKITVDGVAQPILREGRQIVRLIGQAGGAAPVTVSLCDGFETVRDLPLR